MGLPVGLPSASSGTTQTGQVVGVLGKAGEEEGTAPAGYRLGRELSPGVAVGLDTHLFGLSGRKAEERRSWWAIAAADLGGFAARHAAALARASG